MADPTAFAGYFAGNVQIDGTLIAAIKNGVVAFPDGSKRLLHCMESPEHWFEDFGAAQLKGGRAVVQLDSDFAKVIKRGSYHVFLTPRGNCRGLYAAKVAQASKCASLPGTRIAFSYRIVGRRKDVRSHKRFLKLDPPRLLTPHAMLARRATLKARKQAGANAARRGKRGKKRA